MEVQNIQPPDNVSNDGQQKNNVSKLKEIDQYKLDLISLIFAFILIIIFVISGVYLTDKGHDTVGGIIFGTTIICVAGLFITGTYNKTQK